MIKYFFDIKIDWVNTIKDNDARKVNKCLYIGEKVCIVLLIIINDTALVECNFNIFLNAILPETAVLDIHDIESYEIMRKYRIYKTHKWKKY